MELTGGEWVWGQGEACAGTAVKATLDSWHCPRLPLLLFLFVFIEGMWYFSWRRSRVTLRKAVRHAQGSKPSHMTAGRGVTGRLLLYLAVGMQSPPRTSRRCQKLDGGRGKGDYPEKKEVRRCSRWSPRAGNQGSGCSWAGLGGERRGRRRGGVCSDEVRAAS